MTGTRLLNTAVGLATLATALVVSDAGAARPQGIVLSGSRTASVDVTISVRTRLLLDRLTATTRGRWAGVAVESLSRRQVVGASVYVPAVDTEFDSPIDEALGQEPDWRAGVLGTGDVVVAPGRYRLHLITDKSAVVRVPAAGLSIAASPRSPSAGRVTVTDLLTAGAVGVSVHTEPAAMRRGGLVMQFTHQTTAQHVASSGAQCLVPTADGLCETDGVMGHRGAVAGPALVGRGWVRSGAFYWADFVPPGRYTARAEDVIAGRPEQLVHVLVQV